MSRMIDSAARPGDRLSGRRIGVDGFNLSLPKGSGIATYGRNLVAALRNEAAEAHLLYGPAARIGKNAFLNEVALNDAAGTTKAPGLFARETRHDGASSKLSQVKCGRDCWRRVRQCTP